MKRIQILSLSALLTLVTGCSISTPFKWVDEHKRKSTLAENQDEQLLVAVTHATIDATKRKLFDQGASRVIDSLLVQPGLIGYSVRRQLFGDEVWTATVWSDEASMLRFVQSPAHLQAVKESSAAIRNIDYTRIYMRRDELPASWSRLLYASQKKEQPASPQESE
ncbi:antibiotic biosynthesis monooxygenase family protein [Undibacterium sp. Rencai35W]|uniref:antibiotic biosynthesis monooxygenase family protein n=1 Tax=Undibacterium sp. Rencai35W TaxID=3413046 RepID=UPI003BF3EED5